jgi:DNA-binding GntR family transcriptional regulator
MAAPIVKLSRFMALIVRTLSDLTYEQVRKRILTGDIPPGAPLRQDTIAEELGVSKIPLREALGRLEQDGLISSYPNRGYIVRPMSADEAKEVFDLRLAIEPKAAADGARLAQAEHHAAAKQAYDALLAPGDRTDDADLMTLNRQFHLTLIRPGGWLTYQLLERVHIVAERYVRMHVLVPANKAQGEREHQDLITAWLARDAAKIEAVSRNHITHTMHDLLKNLES